MKMKNTLLKMIRYSCLLFVIVFGLMAIIGTNGDGDNGGSNTDPTATITSPTGGSSYTVGDTITFTGFGSDSEDGTLTGSSLVWTSSIHGQIGTGTSFTRNDLYAGIHTITLGAIDSEGATGSDTVGITINQTTSAPSTPIYIYAETTMLLGDWYFYYWIISMFDDYYYLTDISDDTNSQGAHFVSGVDEYGNFISACYWPDDGWWTLLDTGTIIDKYFVFYTDGNTILNNSCYYQISISTGEWSSCFDLYGDKLKLGQFEKSKEEIIDDEELRAAEIDKAELIDDTLKDKYYQLKQLVDPLE